MYRKPRKTEPGLLKSGDRLTDWFFRQFVHFLRKETIRIKRKRRLVNPDDPHRQAIRGLMDPEIHPSGRYVHIFINPARDANRTRDDEVDTLIHELAHVVLGKTSERHVLQLEGILSRRFTRSQRRFIKLFLPRHVVKRYPRMSARATLSRPRIMVL
ncbi:MAG TPA: hypothetical protein VD862_03300 [Candidatus Paceibacterota bacterium]|nr:hypothetical protein [Candidatus Paceibacterota bacterium]